MGYERSFLEIESWMRRQVKSSENYPLVLLFNEPIDQALFLLKFLDYQSSVAEQARKIGYAS